MSGVHDFKAMKNVQGRSISCPGRGWRIDLLIQ
jgi:hypothetical protein